MVSYKIRVKPILYFELDNMYRYIHRALVPANLGRELGSIYHRFKDLPEVNEYMNRELDEITDYYYHDQQRVEQMFQGEIYELLVRKPRSKTKIYLVSYMVSHMYTDNSIQIDVDYEDGSDEVIDIDQDNIQQYFKMTPQFKQDPVKGYNDSEGMVNDILPDDYYAKHNPFPSVQKYVDMDLKGSCRNFTFQVTEDCNLRCFPAGTKITMADYSYKNIEDLKVGDRIIGFNQDAISMADLKFEEGEVVDTICRMAPCVKIERYVGNPIITTPDHPFFTPRGWVEAKHLVDGNMLIRAYHLPNGSFNISLIKVRNVSKYKSQKVYNLTTNTGTYLANDYAVHNCSYCTCAGTLVTMADGTFKKIEDVIIGDRVLSFDGFENDKSNKTLHPAVVTHVFHRKAKCIRLSSISLRKDIIATPEHPFLTSRGFIPLSQIQRNDILFKNTLPAIAPFEQVVRPFTNITLTPIEEEMDVYNLETSSHTYIANDVLTHNCYQISKTPAIMDLETAKSAVDDLLSGRFEYLSPGFSKSIILEFIGGDPLLEIDLIGDIYEYFLQEAYRLNHPWFNHHRISLCSNGMLYFSPATKRFFDKYSRQVSFNISIDGSKSLHDACRVQPSGEGSYDVGIAGVHHSHNVYHIDISSKMTLAPSNVPMIQSSVKNLCFENEYPGINLNCVFEDVWSKKDARVLYEQLRGVADMVFENDRPDLFFSIFHFPPLVPLENDLSDNLASVCGGLGNMLALSPDAKYYPCIRYMPSSLGEDARSLVLGTTKDKMIDDSDDLLRNFTDVTYMSQQNDRCLSCPLVKLCHWCAALCYQYNATPNERTRTNCDMTKAEYLAGIYYWGNMAKRYPEFEIKMDETMVPYYHFEEIISPEEYEELKKCLPDK